MNEAATATGSGNQEGGAMNGGIMALIAALAIVESGGNPNPPGSNDGGKAVGILQIHQGVIDDVNRVCKTDFVLADARDPEKAKLICRFYLEIWATHYSRTTGRAPTAEVLARIWNGGPDGWSEPETELYWNKVRAVLAKGRKATVAAIEDLGGSKGRS